MAEIKLRRRVKCAGDVHLELLKAGWPVEKATEFVRNIPDADTGEVVHGYWRKVYDDSAGWIDVCSICGEPGEAKPYCSTCGTKMDGVANG